MTPLRNDTPDAQTAEAARAPYVGSIAEIDPDELSKLIQGVMDSIPPLPESNGGFHTGCFSPPTPSCTCSFELPAQRKLIEELTATLESVASTLENLHDLAVLHDHRLKRLERFNVARDTDSLST